MVRATNTRIALKQVTFYDFHIHIATQRYQDLGTRKDAFAEPTDRFADFHGALRCLIGDSNLEAHRTSRGNWPLGRIKL